MLSELVKSPLPYSLCRRIGLYLLLAMVAVACVVAAGFCIGMRRKYGAGPDLGGLLEIATVALAASLPVTAAATFAIMTVVRRRMVEPLAALRNGLGQAAGDTDNCDSFVLPEASDDELGDVVGAANHLFKRISAARRDSIYALKAMAERSEVAILTYDARGKIYYANRACVLLCGYGSIEEMAAAPPPRFRFASDPRPATLHDCLGAGLVSREAMLIGPDGAETAVLLNGARVPEGSQTPVRSYATIVDVSALRRTQEQLAQQNFELQSASQAKSEFLANMSHELRTPLNAIIGFSEIIANESFGAVGNDQYLEYSKDINSSGKHLLGIINDILDLSKIEAGRMELHESEFVVADIVTSVVRIVQERAHNAGVRLITRVPDDLPGLYADERSVKQMLINLLSNAVKFTESGGRVVVAADCKKGSILLGVADTGIGMTEEEAKVALEPFRQVDGSHTRAQEGTGLGLPLVRSLIKLHRGRFRIDSARGRGTMVTLGFPAERTIMPKGQTPRNDVPAMDPLLAISSGKFVA
jgi:PAS domain S-box-containing protein